VTGMVGVNASVWVISVVWVAMFTDKGLMCERNIPPQLYRFVVIYTLYILKSQDNYTAYPIPALQSHHSPGSYSTLNVVSRTFAYHSLSQLLPNICVLQNQ
jgi:hypothetical protein